MSQEENICICSGQPVLGYRDRGNAGELSEATLHLLSYKINQALVLRTAFHSLPQLSSTQPPSAPGSIYSLLGEPIAAHPKAFAPHPPPACCRALWLQPPISGCLAAQITPGSFLGQISNLKTLEVTDCSILVMPFRGRSRLGRARSGVRGPRRALVLRCQVGLCLRVRLRAKICRERE